ncbi:Outer membrane receptor proteins, mostly Fe transport [Novosphingobium sp. CF614]|nr:Outer membrane receptor proteins, mostly Fe transport [Novosphingobium sp. CF614]
MLAPGVSSNAEAREAAKPSIDVRAGDLADAIADLSRSARVSIGSDGPLPRVQVGRLRGDMSVAQALSLLLAGTGYRARQVAQTAWRIERAPVAPPPAPALLAVATPAAAPQADPILVTATKQPLDLQSLPGAVALVDTLRLRAGAQALSSTPDIAARIDGLSLTALGPGRNHMFLRGVADSAFGGESQSTVAVVLDEARVTYAAPDPDLRLVDMKRVEVLKGPQGSLYGTGALGGIYRMVSNPANPNEASLEISGGGSLMTGGSSGYSASVVANLPIVDEAAGLRVVGYSVLEPGWINSGTGQDARRNGNSTRVSGFRALAGLVPTDGWRLDLTGMAQWLNSRDSRYTYRRGGYSRPDQLAEPHDNDLSHVATRLQGAIDTVEVMLSSAMTWHEVGDVFDATQGASGFGLGQPRTMNDRGRYRVWDTELRLLGEWRAMHWLVGLSRLDASQTLATSLVAEAANSLLLDRSRRDIHDTAAYANLTVPLGNRLSLSGGGRLFRSSIAEERSGSATATSTQERDRAGFTPELSLSWKPGNDGLFYVRYGSAFRQGAVRADGAALAGDELASVEAGWRQSLGPARIEATAWYSRWDHVQSDTLMPNSLIATEDAGDARILGAEASLALDLTAGWRVEVGANVTHAHLARNALGYELHDSRVPVVPDYTVRAALQRAYRVVGTPMLARLYLRYIGPAHMSFDPELDRGIGRYLESGIEGAMTLGRWQVGLSARNLFGGKGTMFGFGNPLRYRQSRQYIGQVPPTITLTASLGF